MRKWIYMLIAAAGLLAGAAGCKKAPINSDVEGLWVLERFTVAETGETVECERLYYSITRMVTEVAEKDGSKRFFFIYAVHNAGNDIITMKTLGI